MQKRKPTAVKQASALLIALTTAFLLVACGGESSAPADAVLSDSSEATKTSETAKKNAEAVKKAEEAKKENDEKKECKVEKEARKKKSGSDSRREDDDEREDDDRDDDEDEVKTCTPTPPGGGITNAATSGANTASTRANHRHAAPAGQRHQPPVFARLMHTSIPWPAALLLVRGNSLWLQSPVLQITLCQRHGAPPPALRNVRRQCI